MKNNNNVNFFDENVKCTMTGWGFRFKESAHTFRTNEDKFIKWILLFLQRLPVGRRVSISELLFEPDTVVRDKFITALKQISGEARIEITVAGLGAAEFTFYKNDPIAERKEDKKK